jgi:hypothetical protein
MSLIKDCGSAIEYWNVTLNETLKALPFELFPAIESLQGNPRELIAGFAIPLVGDALLAETLIREEFLTALLESSPDAKLTPVYLVTVTALIKCRVDREWTIEKTLSLGIRHLQDLNNFYMRELLGKVEEVEAGEAATGPKSSETSEPITPEPIGASGRRSRQKRDSNTTELPNVPLALLQEPAVS